MVLKFPDYVDYIEKRHLWGPSIDFEPLPTFLNAKSINLSSCAIDNPARVFLHEWVVIFCIVLSLRVLREIEKIYPQMPELEVTEN